MIKLLRGFFFCLVLIGIISAPPTPVLAQTNFPKISIKGEKLYAGDEELLLVSVGYNHVRPGQGPNETVPYKHYGYDLIDQDMKRIKESGFNSVRTWGIQDKKYVELAQKHGLWVVGGIWLDQRIDLSNEPALEKQIQRVRDLAKLYAEFPNVAMLLILNEPDYVMLVQQDPQKMKNYFDRLVEAAHTSCPGVPVSFSNWPNAGFIDSSSWDVISYNLYATLPKFAQSIGYRGLVEGMKKAKGMGKPFYVSEYGFYAPTPVLDPNDAFSYVYVESEKKQADLLLRDMQDIYQLPIAGGALMNWTDNWALASDFKSPKIVRPQGWIDQATHDNDCIEWSGLLSMDKDVKGIPRPALEVISRANQMILTEPDTGTLYSKTLPVSIYLGERVSRVNLIIDGTEIKDVSRSGSHWVRYTYAEKEPGLKKHSIKVTAFDGSNQVINELERTAWTAQENQLPQITVSHIQDEKKATYFIFTLKDDTGAPIPNATVHWGVFDAYAWKEKEGTSQTGPEGTFLVRRMTLSQAQLIGASYLYQRDDFKKKITDLYIYSYR